MFFWFNNLALIFKKKLLPKCLHCLLYPEIKDQTPLHAYGIFGDYFGFLMWNHFINFIRHDYDSPSFHRANFIIKILKFWSYENGNQMIPAQGLFSNKSRKAFKVRKLTFTRIFRASIRARF